MESLESEVKALSAEVRDLRASYVALSGEIGDLGQYGGEGGGLGEEAPDTGQDVPALPFDVVAVPQAGGDGPSYFDYYVYCPDWSVVRFGAEVRPGCSSGSALWSGGGDTHPALGRPWYRVPVSGGNIYLVVYAPRYEYDNDEDAPEGERSHRRSEYYLSDSPRGGEGYQSVLVASVGINPPVRQFFHGVFTCWNTKIPAGLTGNLDILVGISWEDGCLYAQTRKLTLSHGLIVSAEPKLEFEPEKVPVVCGVPEEV